MDERNGNILALPCCLSWIKADYGIVGSAPLEALWNSEGAQYIRYMIASGRQYEICDAHCPHMISKRHNESKLHILDGPNEFVDNQQLNLEEIRQRKLKLNSRPMILKAVPTLSCNIRCSMCFQSHYEDIKFGDSLWEQIGHYLPYVYEITFQGGEVTLDKRFKNFISSPILNQYRHVRVSLITNGTAIDEKLFVGLSRVRLNYIIVSLNAATRETYAKITKKDLFEDAINNIRRLVALASYHPFGKFTVYTSFVVMRSNFKELPKFLDLARKLGTTVKLLNVIGNRGEEDIFVRTDKHEALYHLLDHASSIATGTAKEEVDRIRTILESQLLAKFKSSNEN